MSTNDEAFLDDLLAYVEGNTPPKAISKIHVGDGWDEPVTLRPTDDTDGDPQ